MLRRMGAVRNASTPSTVWLMSGAELGPYRIEAPLGADGMGEVYRAVDTHLDRRVAIKISTERCSDRFEREARAIAALNHPHICTLYDVGIWPTEAIWFFRPSIAKGCERAARSPPRRKQMKKSVLTIALAIATTFVLSQPAALAKSPKGGAAKTTAAKKHHKKHMKKTASAVAPAVKAA
jgi:serine/threonine protein kinase